MCVDFVHGVREKNPNIIFKSVYYIVGFFIFTLHASHINYILTRTYIAYNATIIILFSLSLSLFRCVVVVEMRDIHVSLITGKIKRIYACVFCVHKVEACAPFK